MSSKYSYWKKLHAFGMNELINASKPLIPSESLEVTQIIQPAARTHPPGQIVPTWCADMKKDPSTAVP